MAGFSNETVYGTNVDFSGSATVNPTVTANGQLLIGATAAPNIRVSTLTAGTGVSITNGPGSITISLAGGGVAVEHLTGSSGGQLNPDGSNNFNILGQDGIKVPGSGSTLTVTPRGSGTSNMFLGQGAGNLTLTGTQNVAYGATTLTGITGGSNNTAIGVIALQVVTSGDNNTGLGEGAGSHITTGSGNTAVGQACLTSITTGSTNTAVGRLALSTGNTGDNNTAIGGSALGGLGNGSNNTALGLASGGAYVGTESHNIVIKNSGVAAESNVIRIGTQGSGTGQQNVCYIAGITGVTVSNAKTVYLDTTTGQLGTAGGGFTWNNVTATSATMAANNGYQSNNAGVVTLALPSTASTTFGDTIRVMGFGAGGWTISQAVGQQIIFGSASTTVGVTGALASTNRYDCVELICSSTTGTWRVFNSVGNLTVT